MNHFHDKTKSIKECKYCVWNSQQIWCEFCFLDIIPCDVCNTKKLSLKETLFLKFLDESLI